MVRGLYTASTGMKVQSQKMDIIANDLANVNTVGYKKDTAVIHSFPEILTSRINDFQHHQPNNEAIGNMTLGAYVEDVTTNFMQGSLMKTDGVAHVAIQGDGFFAVETPEGTRYTRDGSFLINDTGRLVTSEGYAVNGQNGPIEIGEAYLQSTGDISINQQGVIMINGQAIDQLRIVTFEDNAALTKLGDNLYMTDQQEEPFAGQVIQGFLETSNVNAVNAMVDMITVSRAYELNQKMIQVHDQLIGKAVNEVGRG